MHNDENEQAEFNTLPKPGQKIGKGMLYITWLIVLGLLTWSFQHWLNKQRNPNTQIKTLSHNGTREIQLVRNRYGHYQASGEINNQTVEFLLDTGATDVAIPISLAKMLGLKKGPALTVTTANGEITTYATQLTEVRLGAIVINNVAATINPQAQGDEVLLGMSFLKHVEFTQHGDTLTIRQLIN